MSHICLQFGQCGIQLGSELFSVIQEDVTNYICKPNLINDSYKDISLDSWFDRKPDVLEAKAILIDTEEKVVNQVTHHPNWCYNPRNIVIDNSGGSANNWAVGYNIKGPKILDDAVEALRKECERCDRLQGFISINSSAGGSGSGISSYFMEQIQNEYSNKTFINVLVLPYFSGEVVIQNYNTLFTLSKLNNTNDATIIFQNDHVHNILTSGQGKKDENVEFTALNRLIAEQLGSMVQPILDHSGSVTRLKFSDITSQLCAHPNYKMLTIKTSPQVIHQVNNFKSYLKWDSLQHCEINMCNQKHLHYRGPKYLGNNVDIKVVANMLISRGQNLVLPSKPHISTSYLYSSWSKKHSTLLHYSQSRKYMKMEQYLTLVTNNSCVQFDLNRILESAWISFINNSFIYLYEKHDVTREDFLEAFCSVENINKLYKDL